MTKVWFPLSERTAVQGWVASFFGRMGGAASFILFGTLMLGEWQLPWRTALAWLAGVGCAFAAVEAIRQFDCRLARSARRVGLVFDEQNRFRGGRHKCLDVGSALAGQRYQAPVN